MVYIQSSSCLIIIGCDVLTLSRGSGEKEEVECTAHEMRANALRSFTVPFLKSGSQIIKGDNKTALRVSVQESRF